MKTLLLLPLLLTFLSPGQNPTTTSDASVAVLAFKWSRTHQKGKVPDPAATAPASPAPEMLAINKNFQKQARMNDPRGARDPNEDTVDARSAAMEKIVEEACSRWQVLDCTVIHRYGELAPTDQIVLVAVSSAHRGDAFAACEFIVDYLKTRAPFWKKELTPDGERWVEARASDDEAAARW